MSLASLRMTLEEARQLTASIPRATPPKRPTVPSGPKGGRPSSTLPRKSEILAMREQDATIAEIADEIGCHYSTVYYHLLKWGMDTRKKNQQEND